jgi:hypothetical protein
MPRHSMRNAKGLRCCLRTLADVAFQKVECVWTAYVRAGCARSIAGPCNPFFYPSVADLVTPFFFLPWLESVAQVRYLEVEMLETKSRYRTGLALH